ncbi:MAG: DUF1573 domain-containing protein [Planctomycetes bacterium]|nr:DUF1573 domain-containing protein [Planctomycetota bacterium]
MVRNYLFLLFVAGFVLLMQLGCQEQNIPVRELSVEPQIEEAEPTEKAETEEENDNAAPIITFENKIADFGQIGVTSSKKVAEFKFTNTGEGLLQIKEVEKCCGVVTKLDKEEFAPGENGVVKAEFQAFQKPGLYMKNIYVNSNDKTQPRIALTIKAMVVSRISYSPKRLRLFLEEENAGCPKIVLNSLDKKPFSITGFTSTGESIAADIDSSVEATKFVLSPVVDIEKLNDNPKGRISISLTHPEEKTAYITFDMLPKFSTSPPLVIAFNAIPEKKIVRKVSVLNNYGGAFEIESVSSPQNAIKVLSQNKIRDGYQLMVEMTPPAAEGKTFFTDVLVVKIKGSDDELQVVCRVFYKQ